MTERLFFGIELPGAARDEIALALPAKVPGRPVPREKWHVTLRFLGATTAEQKAAIVADVQRLPLGERFRAAITGYGAFPKVRRARIVWAGVTEGNGRMGELAATLERCAINAGFEAEPRRYHPHLTLSRIHPPLDVSALVETGVIATTFDVTEVVLFRSHTGDESRYEIVQRFPFEQAT